MRALVLVLVVVAACGRIDFDPTTSSRFASPKLAVFAHAAGDSQVAFDAYIASYAGAPVMITEAPILPTTFAGVDVVLLEALDRTYTQEEAATLHDFVVQGGSLIALSGYLAGAADQSYYDSLLGQWVEYLTPELTAAADQFTPHPVTVGVTSLVYMGGYQLQLVVPGTNIAFAQGMPVGVVASVGAGRICVWGDEWITLDGTFDAQAMRFFSNAFTWLRHET